MKNGTFGRRSLGAATSIAQAANVGELGAGCGNAREWTTRSLQVLAASVLMATPALAQPVSQATGYCPPMWGNWGWMGFGPLSMIVFVGALIALIVFAVQSFGRSGSRASALDILKERYARGEIDQAEFERRKKDIA